MTRGRVVTEHTVRADRWYLEAGRIPTVHLPSRAGRPTCSSPASSASTSRPAGWPSTGCSTPSCRSTAGCRRSARRSSTTSTSTSSSKQGDAWLFRFRFDGTVNGEPFITMRNGVAGFFTAEALAAGKGIVQTDARQAARCPASGRPTGATSCPPAQCSLCADAGGRAPRAATSSPRSARTSRALNLRQPRDASPAGCSGWSIACRSSTRPAGGSASGFVRAEFDIHPDDWFLTCHFVDDMVMPGTLMYECCLHTLRILLMRMGWVGEAGEVVCEPVPGVNSRLKCRGQVIATTKTVTYEVTVKELGYRPEPYCIADALMYADGKPIVEITDMALRMSGLTREKLEAIWASAEPQPAASADALGYVASSPALRLRHDPRLLQRQAVRGVRRAVPRLRPRPRHRPAARAAVPVPRPHHRGHRRAVRAEGRGRVRGRVRRAAGRVVLRREPLPRSCRSASCWRSPCSRAAGSRRTAARPSPAPTTCASATSAARRRSSARSRPTAARSRPP